MMVADLAGVKEEKLARIVRDMMVRFNLIDFENTRAGQLSGGNKRKLCCAMAMMGNPKVIYIDEASAGVDPASRRIMW